MSTMTREKEILDKAKQLEKSQQSWEWWEIPASPAELTKLVTKGQIKIVGTKYHRRQYHTT